MTYSGWTNYETWAANLWLDNDEGTHNYVRELAMGERDVYELATRIDDFVGEMMPGGELSGMPDLDGLASDLLTAALQSVNWREIAQAWLDSTESEVVDA